MIVDVSGYSNTVVLTPVAYDRRLFITNSPEKGCT